MSSRNFTFAKIAEITGSTPRAEHPAADRLTRVSGFGDADRGSIVFAADESTLAEALRTGAGLILTTPALAAPHADPRLLGVDDPRFAFAVCAREFAHFESPVQHLVHGSAMIDASAKLGARVRVAAGAVIQAHAQLGDDVFIGSNAVIAEGVVLGNRVVVQAGAVLGARGFGYVRHAATGEYLLFPQQGALVVEDDVEIGANTTIDRGALEETRIGRGTKIDNLVHVGHNCRIGKNVIIAAQAGISGSTVVEDGAVLAGQVGISDHCHIGPGVILGGQAGVYRGKAVTGPGQVFAGTPAEPLRDQMRALAKLRALARPRPTR